MENNNKKVWCIVFISIILIIGIGVGYYFYNNKEKPVDNYKSDNNKTKEVVDESNYIKILDNKVLRSELGITKNAKINKSITDSKNGIVFLDIIEPEFQFETHYLLCFDKDGNKIFEVRSINDKDNDNNRYKYNGKFEYNESKNSLTFYTYLFLGESDEATGNAFDDKGLSELTSAEKKILGNYSDEVRYNYKYENKKMIFVEKKEISKLKDNAYYKNILN